MAGSLPLMAVSASDEAAAQDILQQVLGSEAQDGVWHVNTKYYTARVALTMRAHTQTHSGTVDAHVVYLAADECASEQPLLGSASAVRVQPGGVLLALCAAAPSDQLATTARLLRCHLVAMVPADDDDHHYGVPAARDALHAHLWPNLQTNHTIHAAAVELSSSDEEQGAVSDDDDVEGMLTRCEQFAAALGAVGAAREEARGADEQWAAARDQRLRRAEDLVLAFTRALT